MCTLAKPTYRYITLNSSLTPDLAVVLKIWGGQNDKFRLIIDWEVHFPSLQYLGDQVILTLKKIQNTCQWMKIKLNNRVKVDYTILMYGNNY